MSPRFIDGRHHEPAGPGTLDVLDPATGAVVDSVPPVGAADADAAVRAAEAAFARWRGPANEEFVALIQRGYRQLRRRSAA